jgi:hypothetical protein
MAGSSFRASARRASRRAFARASQVAASWACHVRELA